jgi:hypothetical protein
MAVTRKGQIIKLGATNDAVAENLKIQAIVLEHSAAAAATLVDTAGVAVAHIRVAANDLFDELVFPCGIIVNGIKASALTASANLYVYIE